MEEGRGRDAMLLALKMEEGASCQGMWVAPRSWKRQGHRFCCRFPRKKTQFCHKLDFSPVSSILNF